jgi:hypothetical protein
LVALLEKNVVKPVVNMGLISEVKNGLILLIKIFISVYFDLPNTWFYSIKETVSFTNKINFFYFRLFLQFRTALRQRK